MRVEGLGLAGEVARSGVKRPGPRACGACFPSPVTHAISEGWRSVWIWHKFRLRQLDGPLMGAIGAQPC